MKLEKNVLKLATVAMSILSGSAFAEGYVGFGAGQASFGNVEVSTLEESGKLALDQNSMAIRAYVGYNFNRYFGAEVVAGNFGTIRVDLGDGDKASINSIKYISLQPKVMFPLYDKFNLFAKAGVGYSFVNATGSNDNGSMAVDVSTFSTAFGLGAEYLFTNNLSVRLNWEYTKPVYDMTEIVNEKVDLGLDIKQIYAGINYRF